MRFEINCPFCNRTQYAEPSILHKMGMLEAGSGVCLGCDKYFRLTLKLDENNDPIKMEAKTVGRND